MIKENKNIIIITALSLLTVGSFDVFASCTVSAVLCVMLTAEKIRNKTLKVYKSYAFFSLCLIVLSYGLSFIWAVDRGEAVFGFLKFLPVLLFAVFLMQGESDKSDGISLFLPYFSAGMTVVSAILMQVPSLEEFFSVSGRLAGFLQYPNTFALVLLISLVFIFTKEEIKKSDYITALILFFGIVYSGSRTVFVLTAVTVAVLVIKTKNKKVKYTALGLFAAVTVGALIFALLTGKLSSFARFLTISLTRSTFVGRFLYFFDALPVILRHPFGLGYLGYYFTQGEFQTGVYTVMFIHNDFLQLLLDIGWLPTGAFVFVIIRAFFKKGNTLKNRLIIFLIVAHSCFDFDLQFISVFMIFITFLDLRSGKTAEIKNTPAVIIVALVLTVSSLYIGFSDFMRLSMKDEKSQRICPLNTLAQINVMKETDDIEKSYDTALKIYSRNKSVPSVYRTFAVHYYYEGDFETAVENYKKCLEKNPFGYDEAVDYCYMLINAMDIYKQMGDSNSVYYCKKELENAAQRITGVGSRLSRLGKMIDDQPESVLPEDIASRLD